MSQVLSATCEGGVVKYQGYPVPGVEILSEGIGPSTGILVIDLTRVYYIAKTTTDLDETLDRLIAVLGKVSEGLGKAVDALTAIDTAGYIKTVTGQATGTASPPVATSDISGVTSAIGEIDGIADELQAIKDALK